MDVRAQRGADIGSDHYLVRANIKLKLKKCGKRVAFAAPFDIGKLQSQETSHSFEIQLQNRFHALQDFTDLDLEDQWTHFRNIVNTAADEVIGRRQVHDKERWLSEGSWRLVEERKAAKINLEQARFTERKDIAQEKYRTLDKEVKCSCRSDKRMWLENKGNEASAAANKGDSKTLYRIVKEITGFNIGASGGAPIKDKAGKSLLTQETQNARWVKHFQETLNQPIPEVAFDFESVCPMQELDVDTDEISEVEISNAIKYLKNNKAAGGDHITAELLKHGGPAVVDNLVTLCNKCWQSNTVPYDWKRGIIVRIPKKGDLSDCNNWRGITLLSVPGKVFLLRIIKTTSRCR